MEENPIGYGYVIEGNMGLSDTDVYGDYRPDNRGGRNYLVTCVQVCALVIAVILIAVLCLNTVTVKAGSAFCDIVGSQTPFSEGMDIAEHDPENDAWKGVPNETIIGKPYLILIGPENGLYVIWEGLSGGVIVAPFTSLETGGDGFNHDTCGYLITWEP